MYENFEDKYLFSIRLFIYTPTFLSRLNYFSSEYLLLTNSSMGSSSSSRKSIEDPNVEAHERFHFRFTDCSCQCDASKKRAGNNDQSQTALLSVLMAQMNRSQYDIREFFS